MSREKRKKIATYIAGGAAAAAAPPDAAGTSPPSSSTTPSESPVSWAAGGGGTPSLSFLLALVRNSPTIHPEFQRGSGETEPGLGGRQGGRREVGTRLRSSNGLFNFWTVNKRGKLKNSKQKLGVRTGEGRATAGVRTRADGRL